MNHHCTHLLDGPSGGITTGERTPVIDDINGQAPAFPNRLFGRASFARSAAAFCELPAASRPKASGRAAAHGDEKRVDGGGRRATIGELRRALAGDQTAESTRSSRAHFSTLSSFARHTPVRASFGNRNAHFQQKFRLFAARSRKGRAFCLRARGFFSRLFRSYPIAKQELSFYSKRGQLQDLRMFILDLTRAIRLVDTPLSPVVPLTAIGG